EPLELLREPLQGLLGPRAAAVARPRVPGRPRPPARVSRDALADHGRRVQARAGFRRDADGPRARGRREPRGRWPAMAPREALLPAVPDPPLGRAGRHTGGSGFYFLTIAASGAGMNG